MNSESKSTFQSSFVTVDTVHIAVISASLGFIAGISSCCVWFLGKSGFIQLPLFIFALSTFHFLEYWVTAKYNPLKASSDSFLLTNGQAYNIAQLTSIIEAILEVKFFPWIKSNTILSIIGLVAICIGQSFRTLAMIHAGRNFSHKIAFQKARDHQLVTTGVYSFSRHPSYFGFFWWAVGTQIFLLNPISTIVFMIVLWRFFDQRIESEEEYLTEFFGDEYVKFKAKVPTRIPFIA